MNHTSPFTKTRGVEHGFSAIEMLVAVALLMVVLGVVVKGMTDVQKRNFSETSNVDAVQDARDFIDQMVRDVHMVGYPPPASVATVNGGGGPVANGNPFCSDNLFNGQVNTAVRMDASVACGIVTYSPTQLVYEADLDGSGTVSVVYLSLVAGGGGSCPCILQRGVVSKANWVATPAAYPAAIQYFT